MMIRRRSKRAAERLDAYLEGRARRVPDELAPLAGTAEDLRSEARAHTLDQGVASQHVAAALQAVRQAQPARPAPVARGRPAGRWRVQVGAALAGAALLAVPATVASASALPGDVLYPVKRGVEEARLIAATSPQAEAETRTRIAQERLDEVRELLDGGRWEDVAGARESLEAAHADAMAAVVAARDDGAEETTVAALESELASVPEQEEEAVTLTLESLPPEEAETVRTLISDPGGGTQGSDPGPAPGTDPTAPPTPTPSVSPTPTPSPTSSPSSSSSTTTTTTTSTTTTTTTSTTTTTTTLPPGSSVSTPSASTDGATPTP